MLNEVFAVVLVALAPFSMMLKLQTEVILDSRQEGATLVDFQ